MDYPSRSSSNWLLPLRVVLISTGVVCTALMLKLSVPVITELAFSDLPSIWSFAVSLLRPPYLYVVINGIIITIVASSKLQQSTTGPSPQGTMVQPPLVKVSADFAAVYDGIVVKNDSVEFRPQFAYDYDAASVAKVTEFGVYEHVEAVVPEMVTTTTTATSVAVISKEEQIDKDELAVSKCTWTPQRTSTVHSSPSTEKPPVSVRFGHRKAVKSSPEGGRSLGVAKPKRHETLENTWKTITEGRPIPLTRHLRKSDTWETHTRMGHLQEHNHNERMTKSETFNDRITPNGGGAHNNLSHCPPAAAGKLKREPSGSWKLKKEPSLGQDELNRRVEAFIKKFNEDMRLQRQESLNQYVEMINRGAH